jgi:hypothetical protein
MLNFFAPGEENRDARESMRQECLKIRDQKDPYTFKYMPDPPDSLAYGDAAEETETTLIIQDVARWVEQWDSHLSRLIFADLTPTAYFAVVAKPLLSIETTGSISVERDAKPLKNKIANKRPNRLRIYKRTVLL